MLHLIVAEGRHQAELTAEIDNGWRRIGDGRWEIPGTGERVTYAFDERALMGCSQQVKVYCGYRWYANDMAERLVRLARQRGNEIIELPTTPLSSRQ